jgi:hypothetical protein
MYNSFHYAWPIAFYNSEIFVIWNHKVVLDLQEWCLHNVFLCSWVHPGVFFCVLWYMVLLFLVSCVVAYFSIFFYYVGVFFVFFFPSMSKSSIAPTINFCVRCKLTSIWIIATERIVFKFSRYVSILLLCTSVFFISSISKINITTPNITTQIYPTRLDYE